MHQSDASVKEHLITSMNDLDKQVMEKTAELLFQKQKIADLEKFKKEFQNNLNVEVSQRKELEVKSNAEISVYKKRNTKLSRQNKVLKNALNEMTRFFSALDLEQKTEVDQVNTVGLLDKGVDE